MQRHGGSRSGICHTDTCANYHITCANYHIRKSERFHCALAEDNGQTFRSDSFGNT
jgi:hypothetical protein